VVAPRATTPLRGATAVDAPAPVRRHRASRPWALWAAPVALLAVIGVVVAFVASGGGGSKAVSSTPAPGPVVGPTNSPPKVMFADPPVSVGSPISLGKGTTPTAMAADGMDVWVAARHEVVHIAGATATPVSLSDDPTSVAVDPKGRVWMTGVGPTHVAILDPSAGNHLTAVSAGPDPTAIAISNDAAWIANSGNSTITRVDLGSPTSTKTIPVVGPPAAIGEAYGRIWVASTTGAVTVLQDDGTRDSIAAPDVPGRTVGIAQSAGVWFLGALGNTDSAVTRVDPRQSAEVNTPSGPQYSKHSDQVAVGPLPAGIGAVNNDFSIWVLSQGNGILMRVGTGGQPAPDAKPDRKTIAQIQFPSPGYLAVGDHVLWVDIPGTGQVYPITF
jgi:streptogramin lyase